MSFPFFMLQWGGGHIIENLSSFKILSIFRKLESLYIIHNFYMIHQWKFLVIEVCHDKVLPSHQFPFRDG